MLSTEGVGKTTDEETSDALAILLKLAKKADAPGFWRALKSHIDVLRDVMQRDPSEYQAWRSEIKTACSRINVSQIDGLLNKDRASGDSQATILSNLVATKCELWHDNEGNAFASLERGGHHENWRIDTHGFRQWLAWLAHSEMGLTPKNEILNSTIATLSGIAKFDGAEREIYRRVASDDSGLWSGPCQPSI